MAALSLAKPISAFFVAGPGADDTIAAAKVVAALKRRVLGLAEMLVERPTVGAAWMLGVNRKRCTAALDVGNDLAGLAHAFFHGHCAGLGQLAVIVPIAECAAGADRK